MNGLPRVPDWLGEDHPMRPVAGVANRGASGCVFGFPGSAEAQAGPRLGHTPAAFWRAVGAGGAWALAPADFLPSHGEWLMLPPWLTGALQPASLGGSPGAGHEEGNSRKFGSSKGLGNSRTPKP